MPIYESDDSDGEIHGAPVRLFGRNRPMYSVLGGGKVADVLLWKDVRTSAALLIGVTSIWFLFEVVEYNFVTLFCHICITAMLLLLIWSNFAKFISWKLPPIPENPLDDIRIKEMARSLHRKMNDVIIPSLLDIAYGRDLAKFTLVTVTLYILSIIGNYFSFVNLLFLVFLGIETLPFLYDRYEDDVDYIVGKWMRGLRRAFGGFNSNVMSRIPRGPVKDKKRY